MPITPDGRMHSAITSGDLVAVKQLVCAHPEVVNAYWVFDTWLHIAAEQDNVPMIEFLVETGLDVNVPAETWPGTPLSCAAMRGAVQAAQWLLDHGATIRPSTQERGGGDLIGAVNSGSLELVRSLLEHGADVNGCYGGEEGGPPRQNALSHALAYGHREIASLLRSYGAMLPDESQPQQTADLHAEIISHFKSHFAPVQPLALTEIVRNPVSIRIHVMAPFRERRCVTLFTTGMSDQAMTLPAGQEAWRYAELQIHLPADWPIAPERLQQPEFWWPVEWLRRIGAFPHANPSWLTDSYAIFSNGDPPSPLAPHLPFTSFLLLTQQSESGRVHCRDGRIVHLYTLFPLYTAERDLALQHGKDHLLALFDRKDVRPIVDTTRRCAN